MKAIINFIANIIDRKELDLLFFKHLYIPDFQDIECDNCCVPLGAYDTKLESRPRAICTRCREDDYEAERTDR